MPENLSQLIHAEPGDAAAFVEKVRSLTAGIVRDYKPARLYVVRIDNWFGPRWLYFSGKALGLIGVYKNKVTLPPFVPHRVVEEWIFAAPQYGKSVVEEPLHVDCKSERALQRRISDFDPDAAFVWFSGESEPQTRGSVMIYLPMSSDTSGFYVSWLMTDDKWDIAMVRGISRSELMYLEERGAAADEALSHA